MASNLGTQCQFYNDRGARCVEAIAGEGKFCPIHYMGVKHPSQGICPACNGSGVVRREFDK